MLPSISRNLICSINEVGLKLKIIVVLKVVDINLGKHQNEL
jgi:hypothetical protein